MEQFGGPSPNMAHAHMNRTDMLPPNNCNYRSSRGPSTPGYSQQQGGGRPPSRMNTPGGMIHASPSSASRQAPPSAMSGAGSINAKVMHIPQNIMTTLKREMGLDNKDFGTLTMAEKVSFLSCFLFRFLYCVSWSSIFLSILFFLSSLGYFQCGHYLMHGPLLLPESHTSNRSGPQPGTRNPNQKPGQQNNNPTAGPSTGITQAPGQGQRGAPPQRLQQRNKRNSTSPGEEVRLT
jgi:hypothetical protein